MLIYGIDFNHYATDVDKNNVVIFRQILKNNFGDCCFFMYVHIPVCVCIHTYMSVHMCVCRHACINIHICIQTNTSL